MENFRGVELAATYPPVSGLRPTPRDSQLIEVLRRENRALRRENAKLMAERHESVIDPRSGLYNRRYFDRRLAQEFSRALRFDMPLSLVILQVGRLREVRDAHGDDVVTRMLRWVSETIQRTCREFDEPCLISEDEVAIVLPSTPADGADAFVRRLARKLAGAATRVPHIPKDAHVTLSFGLSSAPEDAETPLELVMAAEEALFFERGAKSRRGEEIAA